MPNAALYATTASDAIFQEFLKSQKFVRDVMAVTGREEPRARRLLIRLNALSQRSCKSLSWYMDEWHRRYCAGWAYSRRMAKIRNEIFAKYVQPIDVAAFTKAMETMTQALHKAVTINPHIPMPNMDDEDQTLTVYWDDADLGQAHDVSGPSHKV